LYFRMTQNKSKMQQKFSAKQIHILEIAEELIAENGFEKTSVRDISNKAKVNVAMISYYFGSKEKMMSSLYEYRVQRSKEKFSEFTSTITYGNPEMQIKELINFIVGEVFQYKYFHGFVKQEMRDTDSVRDILTEYYIVCVSILEKIIEKGISTGVFKKAAKAEDLLATIVGTVLFTVRNKPFYEKFLNCSIQDLPFNIENKIKSHLHNCVFSVLGYEKY